MPDTAKSGYSLRRIGDNQISYKKIFEPVSGTDLI